MIICTCLCIKIYIYTYSHIYVWATRETENQIDETMCWLKRRKGKRETQQNTKSDEAAKRETENGRNGRHNHASQLPVFV